jgi:Tfp pilus assembly protein PilO
MALVRRAAAEHRRVVIPLVAVFVVNVLVYALAVYPLAQRVANVEQRDRAAEQTLAAARREYDAARGALTGKERASTELARFYKEVLPQDLAGARRLTHLRLAQLARQANLRYGRVSVEPMESRTSSLTRLKITMDLSGSYDDVRVFIYELETAPEFVVIDNIGLGERGGEGDLQFSVELSTYYRTPGE